MAGELSKASCLLSGAVGGCAERNRLYRDVQLTGPRQLCERPIQRLVRQAELGRPVFLGLRKHDPAVVSLGLDVVDDPLTCRMQAETLRLGTDATKLAQFRERAYESLALDHAGSLVYLAPTRINLGLTIERWPELLFRETREHLAAAA